MFRPKFINVVLYLFVKYILFALILAFEDERFKSLVIDNTQNTHEIFMNSLDYLLAVLFFTFCLILIFSLPIYLSLKVKRGIYFTPLIIIIFVAEYFIYTYLASQVDLMNGVYNAILSLLFLLVFFFKHIKLIFQSNHLSSAQ